MISLNLPAKVEREELLQTPLETLVEIILRQQEILEKLAEEYRTAQKQDRKR
jgi:hypothetical protein